MTDEHELSPSQNDIIVDPSQPLEAVFKKVIDMSLGKALDVARIGIQHPPALAQAEKTLKTHHNGLLRSGIKELRDGGFTKWPTPEVQRQLVEQFARRKG
jgi:hypothetical protein